MILSENTLTHALKEVPVNLKQSDPTFNALGTHRLPDSDVEQASDLSSKQEQSFLYRIRGQTLTGS